MSRTKQGLFVAVDGPKGVGKTSILREVSNELDSSSYQVMFTKEPTERFNLCNEKLYTGLGLARLLVDDRRYHLGQIVEPELSRQKIVITDRYIASSLVFQSIDGVDMSAIWAMNQDFRLPDLNIFILADISSLARRRALRLTHTRLEGGDIATEIVLYHDASEWLREHGARTIVIDNSDSRDYMEVAKQVARYILEEYHG